MSAHNRKNKLGPSVAIGAAVGVAVGFALHHVALGFAIGAVAGIVIGVILVRLERQLGQRPVETLKKTLMS